MVKIKVLGSFRIEVDGRPVDVSGRLPRMLLAQLLVARGTVVPTDQIIERLWPARIPPSAQATLHAYVARLRRALEPERPPRAPARLLISAPYGYALVLEQDAVDAWVFERRVMNRTAGDQPPQTVGELAETLDLWGGQPYAEFSDEPWTVGERARLEEMHRTARERLAGARLGAGLVEQALADADALTQEQPLHEEAWRLMALALWAKERQGDALGALRRARRALDEELGVEPGASLVELEQALLHQRLEVLHRATGTRAAPEAPTTLAADRLLGREAELGALAAAADRARQGHAQVVLVSGEAGIGKSSLLETSISQLPQQGWLVGFGQCPETDGAPAGWAWLDMVPGLARDAPPGQYAAVLAPLLTPDGADDFGQSDGSAAQRFRLHRALVGWLRETALRRPLAIVLDDLHRGDQESVELFLLCAEQLRDVPVLLVGSYRAGEGDLTGALARLAVLAPSRLALGGLSQAHAKELLRRGASDMSDHVAAALAERTGGNPFYLRESSLLLAGQGEQQALAAVPQGVQDVLKRRLALLSPAVTAGLRLAAVAGRESSLTLLLRATDKDSEQLLDALEAGVTAGLLTEPRPGTVRFTHALVRDALAADLTRLGLARLHSRLGRALMSIGSDDVAGTAHHLLQAAPVLTADADAAVRHALLAGEQAVRRYAPQNAEAMLSAALDLLTGHPEAFAEQDAARLRVTALGQLVDCRIRMGAIVPAREAQQEAVRVARAERPADGPSEASEAVEAGPATLRTDLLIAAYTTWTEPTPWRVRAYTVSDPEAVEELDTLLASRDLTDRQRCLLLDQLADALDDSDPRAVEVAREAVRLARAGGEPRLRGLTLTSLLRRIDCDLDRETYERLHRELAEVADAEDTPEYSWMSHYIAARIAAGRNDPAEMERCLARADEIARTYELQGLFAVARLRHCMLAMAQGRFDEAERTLAVAVDELRARGAVDLSGLAALSLGCIRVQQGRLAEMLPMLLAVWEQYQPVNEALTALSLSAAGRLEEARAVLDQRVPIQRDFAYVVLTQLRGMAAVAFDDRALAARVYQDLLPLHTLAGGVSNLSMAFRPVAQTLGELAQYLDHPEQARHHYLEAQQVATAWNSVHWADAARTALAELSKVSA
ncbi:BTAD domain-containing putative transcriptional regulator [Streptomyces sp. NPDC046909]|uniref:BTAD domain-containing putative transcriptional regulator n=1 Tax=Streptomyces sp. NPDC046909 TaxID=3155617 RepID=UPI0033E4D4A6